MADTEEVMATKFVIQRQNGFYYQGLGWTDKPLDARQFDTRAEAEQRLRLRPEWKVVEIDVSLQTATATRRDTIGNGVIHEKVFVHCRHTRGVRHRPRHRT
jgi:hypothetical protein